jgi:GPI mannosyltransferase 3
LIVRRNQILAFGLTAHLLAAFFSVGYHQCDELFQVYEFAGYKLGLNNPSELPWEFGERMRSGLQPFIVYVFTKGLNIVSIQNPFTISFVLRSIQSLLSFMVTLLFIRVVEKEIRSPKLQLWLYSASLLAWCMPYFHVRFSSENFSATLFLWALALLLKNLSESPKQKTFLLTGFLFGLSFVCRFQICFMIAGLFAWLIFIKKVQLRFIIAAFSGILIALILGLIIDKWFYGIWVLSWWNYIDLNLFHDKASFFGRQPFYYYFSEALIQMIPPFSLFIIVSLIAFWIRFKSHVITWITLPFILLHFFVSHKELRFLFPVLYFLPFMVVFYLQSLEKVDNKVLRFLRHKSFIRLALLVNTVALVAFVFRPADNVSPALKKIYDLAQEKKVLLIYENKNPYNKKASLNYFRNTKITMVELNSDTLSNNKIAHVYYFSERFNEGERITKGRNKYVRIYSNFPPWSSYFNFNGWLDRAVTFSIYKKVE